MEKEILKQVRDGGDTVTLDHGKWHLVLYALREIPRSGMLGLVITNGLKEVKEEEDKPIAPPP